VFQYFLALPEFWSFVEGPNPIPVVIDTGKNVDSIVNDLIQRLQFWLEVGEIQDWCTQNLPPDRFSILKEQLTEAILHDLNVLREEFAPKLFLEEPPPEEWIEGTVSDLLSKIDWLKWLGPWLRRYLAHWREYILGLSSRLVNNDAEHKEIPTFPKSSYQAPEFWKEQDDVYSKRLFRNSYSYVQSGAVGQLSPAPVANYYVYDSRINKYCGGTGGAHDNAKEIGYSAVFDPMRKQPSASQGAARISEMDLDTMYALKMSTYTIPVLFKDADGITCVVCSRCNRLIRDQPDLQRVLRSHERGDVSLLERNSDEEDEEEDDEEDIDGMNRRHHSGNILKRRAKKLAAIANERRKKKVEVAVTRQEEIQRTMEVVKQTSHRMNELSDPSGMNEESHVAESSLAMHIVPQMREEEAKSEEGVRDLFARETVFQNEPSSDPLLMGAWSSFSSGMGLPPSARKWRMEDDDADDAEDGERDVMKITASSRYVPTPPYYEPLHCRAR